MFLMEFLYKKFGLCIGLWLIEAGSAHTRREMQVVSLFASYIRTSCWIIFRTADCLSYILHGLSLRVKIFIDPNPNFVGPLLRVKMFIE